MSKKHSRRQFLGGTLSAVAAAPLLEAATSLAAVAEAKLAAPPRKIKLGLVGCGGRGAWIGKLFQQHGGYELHAVADYFQQVADRCGDALRVDKKRRFSGLSGYTKVIESGVEAVALIVPPCFLPEHSSAAAEAGLHVYMAKPVAVDVPGCLRVEAAGKQATQKQKAFFVDYQIPTDPKNIEVYGALRDGKAGKLARMLTTATDGGRNDPPKTANIESRLQGLVWDNDIALGGGMNVSFDIHAIDAGLWLTGQRPTVAMGSSCIVRPNPHGDSADVASVVFEYADGLIHEHFSQHLPNHAQGELSCKVFSYNTRIFVDYWGRALFQIRGQKPLGGSVENLYELGAKRNIATFYEDMAAGRCENPTVRRAVDGCLTCILGREAAFRHGRLTMDELLKEDKRIEVDLTGLKT